MKSLVAPQSSNNSTLESRESSPRARMRPRIGNKDACSGSVSSTLTLASVDFFSGLLVLMAEFRTSRGRPPPGLRRCLLGLRRPFSAVGAGSKMVPCCLGSDLFVACLILNFDFLFLEMAVGSSNSRGPSRFTHHSCSSAWFLDHLGNQIAHFDVCQCRRVVLLRTWQLYRDSWALAQTKPWVPHLEPA